MGYSKKLKELDLDYKLTPEEGVAAVFEWPGLYQLRAALADLLQRDDQSDQQQYQDVLMFGLLCAARACGSQRDLIKRLKRGTLWPTVVSVLREMTGYEGLLPPVPSERRLDLFMAQVSRADGALGQLGRAFMGVSIDFAKALGQFPDTSDVDWTCPDPRGVMFADGMFLDPYSKVQRHVDRETGEITYVGSRAKFNHRYQEVRTNDTEDHTTRTGINHIFAGSRTDFGWVVVGVDRALGDESVNAEDLMMQLATSGLRDGFHTLVYDRVMRGVLVARLMAEHGIGVTNKSSARGGSFRGGETGYSALGITGPQARARFAHGEPLPVGTSVYARSTGSEPEVVSGEYHRLERHSRFITDGGEQCFHELWMDDGALVTVEMRDDHYWKVGTASATSSTRVLNDQGLWDQVTAWTIPCRHGDHEYQTCWTPKLPRFGKSRAPFKGREAALAKLRSMARVDGRFRGIHGLRNNAESLNAAVQRTMGSYQRATHLDDRAQFVDVLAACVLVNATTWFRKREADRFSNGS